MRRSCTSLAASENQNAYWGSAALSRFTENLPSLDADIHPDGKHSILDAGITQITPEHVGLYNTYQKALQRASLPT